MTSLRNDVTSGSTIRCTAAVAGDRSASQGIGRRRCHLANRNRNKPLTLRSDSKGRTADTDDGGEDDDGNDDDSDAFGGIGDATEAVRA